LGSLSVSSDPHSGEINRPLSLSPPPPGEAEDNIDRFPLGIRGSEEGSYLRLIDLCITQL